MPPIYIGSSLAKLRVGAQIVSAVYIGPTLAYSANTDFSPAALFAEGEQGVWYDPSDMSTLYQDSAGTTPVTAVGQPVGKMLDKSGRGNHITQLTSTSRPIYQIDANGRPYLNFDGVDDWLQTASIDFTGTDKLTLWVAIRKLSDAATGVVAELSNNFSNAPGTFLFAAPSSGGTIKFRFLSKGTLVGDASTSAATYSAPYSAVVGASGDIAGDRTTMRVNGAVAATSTSDQGAGAFGNHPLYIGRRGVDGTLPFNGRIYGLIIRGGATPDPTISLVEGYLNSKSGAY